MSSSIDRAFIRAFAKQQGDEPPTRSVAPTPAAPRVDASPIGTPAAAEPPSLTGDAETVEDELTRPRLAAKAETVVSAEKSADARPVVGPAAESAAEAAVETAAETESRPRKRRRIDPPQPVSPPVFQPSLVTANTGIPSLGITTFEVAQPHAETDAAPEAVEQLEPPRPTVQALSPEQVVRRLDDVSNVSPPHGEEPDDASVATEPDAQDGPPVEPPAVDDEQADADRGAARIDEQDPSADEELDAHKAPEAIAPAPEFEADEEVDSDEAESSWEENSAAPVGDPAEETRPVAIQGHFVPAWETDAIQWPRMAERLTAVDDRFRDAGRQLASATSDGLRVLAVTSTYRGEGRTTVAMNLARAAADAGVRVALVDGDVDNPALASAAGIAAAHGWHECLLDGLPLDEAAVASLEDGVTLVPLTSAVRRAPVEAATAAFASMLDTLTVHFDLVIVDYGPIGAGPDDLKELAGDAAILVRDIRCTSAEQALATVGRIRGMGAKSVGVVQNFT